MGEAGVAPVFTAWSRFLPLGALLPRGRSWLHLGDTRADCSLRLGGSGLRGLLIVGGIVVDP